ncbi:hypothetical protein KDW86_04540 [Burkholderia ambifaria]|nr:hypothetical protein [Burkholderia ambifaria]
MLLPRCAHGNECDSSHIEQFPNRGIFFDENLQVAGLRMARQLGRLRADARACVAGDVAAQVAARHGLPIGRRGGRLLAKGIPVFLLAVRLLAAIIGASGGGQRQ